MIGNKNSNQVACTVHEASHEQSTNECCLEVVLEHPRYPTKRDAEGTTTIYPRIQTCLPFKTDCISEVNGNFVASPEGASIVQNGLSSMSSQLCQAIRYIRNEITLLQANMVDV